MNATETHKAPPAILQTILEHKRQEVEQRQRHRPLRELKAALKDVPPPRDFRSHFTTGFHIIAEFKKASPSRGIIAADKSLVSQVQAYQQGGATAISILTDEQFFKGSPRDLVLARQTTLLPILRKEFIISEYQVWESRVLGADAILLIAAALTPSQVARFSDLAGELGMSVLLELHQRDELKHIPKNTHHLILGINNRNLHTFEVSLHTSLNLKAELPGELPAISESGVSTPAAARQLKEAGFQGLLVGEALMRADHPDQLIQQLLQGGTA